MATEQMLVLADDQPRLEIQPNGPVITKEVGGSLAVTCKPNVPDSNLISQLEWRDVRGRRIETTNPTYRLYVQQLSSEPGAVLVFTKLEENLAGVYTCSASYDNTERLTANVTVQTIVDITFTDAPENQYPKLGSDYKIKCEVKGRPQPLVDWLRNGQVLTTNDRYIIDNNGLQIKNVKESDDGIYICSAVVIETGNIKSRTIKVEVQVPPQIEPMEDISVIEGETASTKCVATGKPPPSYTWIKDSTQQDLSRTDRFGVQPNLGVLIINRVEYNDNGVYTCVANNSAGQVDAKIRINVLVKPRIYELLNITTPVDSSTKLICKAYGRPPPEVIFKKVGNREPFRIGSNGDRILLESMNDMERGETTGILNIERVNRSDDGLYECIAKNPADTAYKNGHITVEFPPTFEKTKDLPPVWTWNNKPGNLSCLPEAIPNATIQWKYGNFEINNNSGVFEVNGNAQQSFLIVKAGSNDKRYFTTYECIAKNKLGVASNFIQLKLADVPQPVQQVKITDFTATSVKFDIVPPSNLRGLPLRSFTVWCKDARDISWDRAWNHTWSVDAPYILENLVPEMTYTFRFAARNDVGLGRIYGDTTFTMPRRSVPAEPKILVSNYPSIEDNTVTRDGIVAVSPYANHFELRWNVPNDNGDPITDYVIRYCVTQKINGEWRDLTEECSEEVRQSSQHTSYDLNDLQPDTTYKIELRARNAIGHSSPAQIKIRTARGMDIVREENASISSSAIIGIVIAAILLVLIVVDVVCYCVVRAGILALLCDRARRKPDDEDPKLGRDEKEPLRPEVKDDPRPKGNTYVEFDGQQVYSKSGELIGKHSAV